ncbi:MAG: hypothetical protein IKD76_07800 [Clostridia bacterium]|nr:hypothetical protein [Clostridia bacterium]
MLFDAFRKQTYTESEERENFSNIILPMGDGEGIYCDKMMFSDGKKNNVIIGLHYNRVPAKTVSLHDITSTGIRNFEELCYTTSNLTVPSSPFLDKAVVYNLYYLREVLNNMSKEPTSGMDISKIFNKEYYNEQDIITVDTFTKKMLKNFNILCENDSELLLQLK